MKKRIKLILLFLIIVTIQTYSQVKLNGTLVNEKAQPVEFANIVLQSGDEFHGGISDLEGHFTVEASPGSYLLKISVIGYDSYEKEIDLKTDMALGEIQMKEFAVSINEVVVKADRVIRKSDRFVVNLLNDPTVFGKTGTDILNQSPGVFIQERDGMISINGKSGTQVIVNERPLHETGTDLIRYLQTLKAEDIERIEVLPTADATYDANITGGVIKIILKRQRNDGINGNAGSSYSFAPGEKVYALTPSFTMNYKINGLSLYTMLNYDVNRSQELTVEDVWSGGRDVHSEFDFPIKNKNFNARLGGVYELSDRQSIGLEGYYSGGTRKNNAHSELTEISHQNRTDISSFFQGKNTGNSYSTSANYILKLDSTGSVFKVLLDYYHNNADDNQNYHSSFSGYQNYDSIYRSNMLTINDMYVASTDLSMYLNENTTFSIGLKYTRNEMENDVLFEYQKETSWHENNPYSSKGFFTEDIAAIYSSFSSTLKRISYSIGLRGEYTHVSPKTNKSDLTEVQRYFKLFPTANIMLPLGSSGVHSVVLNYSRKIHRPSFALLNPFRLPASEFLYIEGNPKLLSAISDEYTASFRLFGRYGLTVGITDTQDAAERVVVMDTQTPGVIIQRMDNVAKHTKYYLSANASLNPFRWWQIHFSMTGYRDRIKVLDKMRSNNTFQGYMAFMLSLPKDVLLDLNGYYMTPFISGNTKTEIDPIFSFSARKQFFDNNLSVKLFVNNIFDTGMAKVTSDEKDFRRDLRSQYYFRQFGVALTYNFKMGKSVQVKNVETGAAEEKARLR